MSGEPAAPSVPREHEIRVSGCLDGGCGEAILRCSCGETWNVEPDHTIAELSGFAAQHAAGQAPGRPRLVPLPTQGEGRPGQ